MSRLSLIGMRLRVLFFFLSLFPPAVSDSGALSCLNWGEFFVIAFRMMLFSLSGADSVPPQHLPGSLLYLLMYSLSLLRRTKGGEVDTDALSFLLWKTLEVVALSFILMGKREGEEIMARERGLSLFLFNRFNLLRFFYLDGYSH